jgi:hypothetical protein
VDAQQRRAARGHVPHHENRGLVACRFEAKDAKVAVFGGEGGLSRRR